MYEMFLSLLAIHVVERRASLLYNADVAKHIHLGSPFSHYSAGSHCSFAHIPLLASDIHAYTTENRKRGNRINYDDDGYHEW